LNFEANESVEKPFFEEKFSGLKVQKIRPDDSLCIFKITKNYVISIYYQKNPKIFDSQKSRFFYCNFPTMTVFSYLYGYKTINEEILKVIL
jgi:hypothetical protein